MALKLTIPFPIFAPQLNPYVNTKTNSNSNPPHHRSPSEVRFSRWYNANAERFEQRRRTQQEIEDEIRRERRFDSATKIAEIDESVADTTTSRTTSSETFRSRGTPSSPSRPSIPGKKSKYSKSPNASLHPAFRPISRTKKFSNAPSERPVGSAANVSLGEDGISYVIDGAPFEFKYSYTETPKVKPIKLREPPYAPFGPTTMPRPWTGRAPLPPSKKKLKEFDSFQLPPPNKKGVKPVQAPGPFLPGSGPKYVRSREEILGEPLTEEEITALVNGCMKSKRQMNMGRDGLTHNMLDNIHAHWKRRRVCKIKCKGVCTVDMDNVRQQLEEKTGGKIIYSKGGVLYLFRGRNYNYKTRPRFPIMLWRPVTPVYPRLIKRVPEDLTLEEATEMRKKGRKLIPICKLGKNGVYSNLVENVREAFEACELVRINCQGMNGSDFRKIGAKLKDLVPCVLISFESEHILMWRGRDWDPRFKTPDTNQDGAKRPDAELSLDEQDVVSETNGEVYRSVYTGANTSSDDDNDTKMSSISSGIEAVVNDTSDNTVSETSEVVGERLSVASTELVLSLLKKAVENGSAIVLDDSALDADTVYQRAVEFSQSAPLAPVFRHQFRKIAVPVSEKETEDMGVEAVTTVPVKEARTVTVNKGSEKSSKTRRKRDFSEDDMNVVPHGSLKVDELAKLLA